MNTERYKIYLGALLHGLGGNEPPSSLWKDANKILTKEEQSSNKESDLGMLSPILTNVHLEGKKKVAKKTGQYYYAPNVLKLSDETSFFPIYTENIAQDILSNKTKKENILKELWTKLSLLSQNEVGTYTAYHLLFKYTARLKAKENHNYNDVGLFDEIRLQAALVNCLSAGEEVRDFVLIKGDISGIQKFIYSEIDMSEAGNTDNLSKKLRGRSFYIALLTDLISELYAEALGVAQANILYAGGGHFLLLAPKFANTENIIRSKEEEINRFILQKIGTRVSLLVGAVDCSVDIFHKASDYIRAVGEDLNKRKFQKHHPYLEELFYGENDLVIKAFKDDEKMGTKLPYTTWIIELELTEQALLEKGNELQSEAVACFETFHRYFFMIETEDDKINSFEKLIATYQKYIISVKLNALNHTDFLKYQNDLTKIFPDLSIGFGFKFMGSFAPKDAAKNVLNFEKLSESNTIDTDKKDLGFPLLAVTRLDVDDLGALFSYGMGNDTSLARTATLSRELYLFFNGYLNTLAKKFNIYVVYSGGDDAFVVGSWLNMIHFVTELNLSFKRFCCENPSVTFSAGIFLCNEHYPVAKFAQKSEEAEKRAKRLKDSEGDEPKNAICVFDHALSFDAFHTMFNLGYKIASEYVKQDDEKIQKISANVNGAKVEYPDKIARSLVHRILRMIKVSIKEDGYGQKLIDTKIMYRNSTQLHYLFARQGYTNNVVENIQQGIVNDVIKIFLSNFTKEQIIQDYQIPTTYVIYKTRKVNK